jgi:choline dehydrogenase
LAAPDIRPNYLEHPLDQDVLLKGVKLARKIASAPAFLALVESETRPGSQVQSDDELLNFVRSRASSIYHPVGTCQMGKDENAVVDSELNVHGISGLRVADASIMPTITSGNSNAPTIMIAEKAADLIEGAAIAC